MSTSTLDYLDACRRRVDVHLIRSLGSPASEYTSGPTSLKRLFSAMEYVLAAGGKRVRPALVYATAEALGATGKDEPLDYAACSLEFIHTYSLVHDDLPAMDDDDLRRGQPTCHRAFDEATAILVGDGLQARAFELLCEAPGLPPEQHVELLKILSAASGPRGMVGGQAIDTAGESAACLDSLRAMHELKTGALIRAAVQMAAAICSADSSSRTHLDIFARNIGLAFQVKDDILDVVGHSKVLGKTGGKDDRAGKTTYTSLLGLDGAQNELESLLQAALSALEPFGANGSRLHDLALFIARRES